MVKRITIDVPTDLHKSYKVACEKKGIKMRFPIIRAMEEVCRENKRLGRR